MKRFGVLLATAALGAALAASAPACRGKNKVPQCAGHRDPATS